MRLRNRPRRAIAATAAVALAAALTVAVTLAPAAPIPRPLSEPQAGVLLVASSELTGSGFARTVVLLLAHGDDGSIGLVLNRPSQLPLRADLPRSGAASPKQLLLGGPVDPGSVRALVAADGAAAGTTEVLDGVFYSDDLGVLDALARSPRTRSIRYYAGYSGWAPEQLTAEIRRGDWYLVAADPATIFATADDGMWRRLIRFIEGQWAWRWAPRPSAAICERDHESLEPGADGGSLAI